MQSWKWRRMLKLMHTPLSTMVSRYSWNLRCERKLWHRKLFVTVEIYCWKGIILAHREKRRILRKYWILKTNYIYKFPCSSVLSVVCTVKIEFSSELISQIRGVILYLADEHWVNTEHDPASAPSPRLQRWVHLSSVAEAVSFSPWSLHQSSSLHAVYYWTSSDFPAAESQFQVLPIPHLYCSSSPASGGMFPRNLWCLSLTSVVGGRLFWI